MISVVQEQYFYEIAMAIGNSLDLQPMLRESLTAYLRKLNCVAGMVLKSDQVGNFICFEPVYVIPRRVSGNKAMKAALDQVPADMVESEYFSLVSRLPLQGEEDGLHYVIMPLKDFGVLILVRFAPLSASVLNSLDALNLKLANAARSCLSKEMVELMNIRLKREAFTRRRAEKRYRSIFQNAQDGMFQMYLDGQVLNANPAMVDLLGFSSVLEMKGQVKDLFNHLWANATDREHARTELQRNGRISGYESRVLRRDGTLLWAKISAILVTDDTDQGMYLEGVCEDIDDQKSAQHTLQLAKEEAENISRIKSDFLGKISQELRDPLTSIMGFASLTKKHLPQQDQPEGTVSVSNLDRVYKNLEIIITESKRMTQYVDHILALDSLNFEDDKQDHAPVLLNEVLSSAINEVSPLYQEKRIGLVHEIQSNMPAVLGNHKHLTQVCSHILTNALNNSQGGVVNCTAFVESDSIVVQVEDSGVGIDPEKLERIFDRARDSSNTPSPSFRVSLGLPICKQIIARHGGVIWATSTPGKGSMFSFRLPTI